MIYTAVIDSGTTFTKQVATALTCHPLGSYVSLVAVSNGLQEVKETHCTPIIHNMALWVWHFDHEVSLQVADLLNRT